jgi:hypothetical protein
MRFEVGKLFTCPNPDCKLHLCEYDAWDEDQNFCSRCATPLQNVDYDDNDGSKLKVERERLTNAISRFLCSARELQDIWSQVSKKTDNEVDAAEGYPFPESFEYVMATIERWLHVQKDHPYQPFCTQCQYVKLPTKNGSISITSLLARLRRKQKGATK